jgi:chloramphenicol O-acetyltransferase type A
MITKAVNSIPQFKYGFEHEKLVRYSIIHPSFPFFINETKNCRIMKILFNENFSEFRTEYNTVTETPDMVKATTMIKNLFTVSMESRIHFTSFSFSTALKSDFPNLRPSIITGKYIEKEGRFFMPFSLTINHIAADGYHASVLFDKVQAYLLNPNDIII